MIALLAFAAMMVSDTLVTADDPQSVLSAMQSYAPAELGKVASGDPVITGTYKDDSDDYSVFFLDCKDGADCRSVTFFAWWDVTGVDPERIDAWNETAKFGKAYTDDDGNPILEMSVNLYGGVTRENFVDTVDWWHVAVADFDALVRS